MPRFALYHYPTCYFCRRVFKTLSKLGIEAELRNIHEDARWRNDIIEARGRQTVPVLRIENDEGEVEWMGESRDIVNYLSSL